MTQPGYWWTDGDKVYHRSSFMKKVLKDKLENFDESKSEADNMFANGYRRLWDCGQFRFTLTKPPKS